MALHQSDTAASTNRATGRPALAFLQRQTGGDPAVTKNSTESGRSMFSGVPSPHPHGDGPNVGGATVGAVGGGGGVDGGGGAALRIAGEVGYGERPKVLPCEEGLGARRVDVDSLRLAVARHCAFRLRVPIGVDHNGTS
eukprot:CAMPEP_0206306662 /NCGR_PEP_ID=MMETSP0106_2-20121207/10918_1 /ASSEMBLY_ACC=CAM_ASM_000206 /TAXON_ID=81532 /ORGANISM="Acanthoeca-like sp., Strain 10tr" /LENGTH=138 /DNA_ID=CAMNT_0053737595 /DNA_START=197 /DNA_END=613 /DNA_ORIENTATION=-